jgi:hypothetical protein
MTQNPKIYDYSGIALYKRTTTLAIWFYVPLIFIPLPEIARKRRFVCLRKRRTRCGHFHESQKEGMPQEVIDKYDGIIRKSFIDFEFRLTITRTSAKIHDTASNFYNFIWKRRFYRTSKPIVWCESRSVLSRPFCNELAQNAVTKKRIHQCEKWFDAECYRFNQPKINHNRRTPIMKSTKHWFCLWIVMKIS